MYNWSTDLRELKKDKEKYAIWKLEQMVNFGLAGQKLDEKTLRKHFSQLNIDPARRKFLHLLLFGRLPNPSQTRILCTPIPSLRQASRA